MITKKGRRAVTAKGILVHSISILYSNIRMKLQTIDKISNKLPNYDRCNGHVAGRDIRDPYLPPTVIVPKSTPLSYLPEHRFSSSVNMRLRYHYSLTLLNKPTPPPLISYLSNSHFPEFLRDPQPALGRLAVVVRDQLARCEHLKLIYIFTYFLRKSRFFICDQVNQCFTSKLIGDQIIADDLRSRGKKKKIIQYYPTYFRVSRSNQN